MPAGPGLEEQYTDDSPSYYVVTGPEYFDPERNVVAIHRFKPGVCLVTTLQQVERRVIWNTVYCQDKYIPSLYKIPFERNIRGNPTSKHCNHYQL